MTTVRQRAKLIKKIIPISQLRDKPKDELDAIGEELIQSTLDSMRSELESSPAARKMAKKFSSVITEFMDGFAEGVRLEIENFRQQNPGVNLSPLALEDETVKLPENNLDEAQLKELKKINDRLGALEKQGEGITGTEYTDNTNTPPPVTPKTGLQGTQGSSEVNHSVLAKTILERSPIREDKNLALTAKQIAIGVLGGITDSLGFSNTSASLIEKFEESKKQEQFISTETKIRSKNDPEGFGKLSVKEQREQLKESYKEINKSIAELQKLEREIASLKESGYSEKDIETVLKVSDRQKEHTTNILKHDSSRAQQLKEVNTNSNQQTSSTQNNQFNYKEVARQALTRSPIVADENAPLTKSQVGTGFLGGFMKSLGFDNTSDALIERFEESKKQERFIGVETKLRSAADPTGFGALDPKEQRKQLKESYKEINKSTAELQKLENSASELRSAGYSESDIESALNYSEIQKQHSSNIAKHDVSRVSTINKTKEETSNQNNQTNRETNKDTQTNKEVTNNKDIQSTLKESHGLESMVENSNSTTLSTVEETRSEELKLKETELSESKEQTKLLGDIKGILDRIAKVSETQQKQPAAGDSSASGGPGVADLADLVPDLDRNKSGKPSRTGKLAGKVRGFGSSLLKNSSGILKGAGLLTAGVSIYQGANEYLEADKIGEEKLASIDAQEKSGEITKDQAAELRKSVNAETTENKGGAVGGAGGAIAGAVGGAKLGAMAGSVFGPAGTLVGGLAGGAIGGLAGSSAGKSIGKFVGNQYTNIKNALGFGNAEVSSKTTSGSVTNSSEININESQMLKEDPEKYKQYTELKKQIKDKLISDGNDKEEADAQAKTLAYKQIYSSTQNSNTWSPVNSLTNGDNVSKNVETNNLDTSNTLFQNSSALNSDSRSPVNVAGSSSRISNKLESYAIKESTTNTQPNIVVQPTPVVVNNQQAEKSGQQRVETPFTQGIRNAEASIMTYLKTRYTFAI